MKLHIENEHWHVQCATEWGDVFDHSIRDSRGHKVMAKFAHGDDFDIKKLQLMAAAPDMYRALKAILKSDCDEMLVEAVEKVRDAVNLAEGKCMPSTITGE